MLICWSSFRAKKQYSLPYPYFSLSQFDLKLYSATFTHFPFHCCCYHSLPRTIGLQARVFSGCRTKTWAELILSSDLLSFIWLSHSNWVWSISNLLNFILSLDWNCQRWLCFRWTCGSWCCYRLPKKFHQVPTVLTSYW
jgi:hypothetical protein